MQITFLQLFAHVNIAIKNRKQAEKTMLPGYSTL